MARNSAGAFVAGLTAVALATVSLLAYQASAAHDRASQSAKPGPTASESPAASNEPKKDPTALPADSGSGKRVVYALEAERVWLVDGDDKVTRTYDVSPGTVSPLPGEYTVSSRSGHVTGSDGVPVENVVRFTEVGGTGIGFSAAVKKTKPTVGPEQKTGGIRESRKDGEAMWMFATIGTKVVVVP